MRLIFNAYKRIVSNWTGESIESGLYINSNAREQERRFFVSGGIILLFSSTHVGIYHLVLETPSSAPYSTLKFVLAWLCVTVLSLLFCAQYNLVTRVKSLVLML